jgi:hypothetical protein
MCNSQMIKIFKSFKSKVKSLLYLGIFNPNTFFIKEIDASYIGYEGIFKQKN